MGPLTSQEYQEQLNQSDNYKKYHETVDPKSAFEILSEKMEAVKAQQQTKETTQPKTTSRARQEKSSLEQVMASPITKQIGKEIVRGVFGMLFGSAPRRRR